MSNISLSQLKVNTKTVELEFPNIPGFLVTISAVSRELSRDLRKKAEKTRIDPKLRTTLTEIDEEIFLKGFAEAAIKGWKGLRYKDLPSLMLVDMSLVPNPDEEVDFSIDNAIELLKSSTVFDTWINDEVFSIERFRNGKA